VLAKRTLPSITAICTAAYGILQSYSATSAVWPSSSLLLWPIIVHTFWYLVHPLFCLLICLCPGSSRSAVLPVVAGLSFAALLAQLHLKAVRCHAFNFQLMGLQGDLTFYFWQRMYSCPVIPGVTQVANSLSCMLLYLAVPCSPTCPAAPQGSLP
jgi:hypothetical protein